MDALSPIEIEQRLGHMWTTLDEAFSELEEAEYEFHELKTRYEIGMAKARIVLTDSAKMTVSEKDDRALLANEDEAIALAVCEARVKAARANTTKLRAQVDIVRSQGAVLRATMDL